MSKFTDFLINALLPTIEAVGQSKLVEVLQKFHEKDPEQYAVSIQAGHTFIKPLIKLVTDTPNKIDDGFVEAVDEAITISAAANGIVFTDQA